MPGRATRSPSTPEPARLRDASESSTAIFDDARDRPPATDTTRRPTEAHAANAARVSGQVGSRATIAQVVQLADGGRFEIRDILREEGVELRIGPANAESVIETARDLECVV